MQLAHRQADWRQWVGRALAHAGQPRHLFDAIDDAISREVGRRYLTILAVYGSGEAQRVFTTVPDVYPVGGRKTLPMTAWREHVLDRAEPFLAATDEDLDRAYPDAATVRSLGCGTLLNLPAVYDGRVVGLLNVAHAAGSYGAEQVTALQPYAALIAPVLRLHFMPSES